MMKSVLPSGLFESRSSLHIDDICIGKNISVYCSSFRFSSSQRCIERPCRYDCRMFRYWWSFSSILGPYRNKLVPPDIEGQFEACDEDSLVNLPGPITKRMFSCRESVRIHT